MLLNELDKKLLSYLKRKAPYSVVDLGIALASNGDVAECSKAGARITGIVRTTGEDESFSTSLDILSGHEIEAKCSCCSAQDIAEQWCQHAVALLWHASSLNFFDPHSGFAAKEAVYRMNTSSPSEIAAIISEVSQRENIQFDVSTYHPAVTIELDFESDRLGVKVLFDDEPQAPALFGGYNKKSARALDNLLLDLLEQEGNFDEANHLWFINSSTGIETILSLIQEYPGIHSTRNHRPVTYSSNPLDARLSINWLKTSVELVMHWVMSDGTIHDKSGELIGTGPYWTAIDNVIYRVSPSGSRIASVFPYSATITLTRSQVGPILEAIGNNLFDPNYVSIINPELQPASKVKNPTPYLELEQRTNQGEHFSSNQFEIQATLTFDYPTPPENENVVFLPNREKEREYIDYLRSLGFVYVADRRKYIVSGDSALDLLFKGAGIFEDKWHVSGLEDIKKAVKFSNLTLNVAISSASGDNARKKSSSIDWFDCHVSLIQNNANVPLSTLFKNINSRSDRWIKLDSGAYARVPGGGLNNLKTTLGLLDTNFRLSNSIKAKLSVAQAISLSRLDEEEQLNLAMDRKLESLAKKLRDFKAIAQAKVSKGFTGKLRHYQEEGLSWLLFLNEFRLGGILADEMGLGKTVQALSLLQSMKDSSKAKRTKPTLIVAPTSVITNWMYEAKRFTPKLKVLLLHGPRRKMQFPLIKDSDIVVTSYALLRVDRAELEKEDLNYLILDEAQNIKNPQAATTKAAKALNAEHRLAMTGTPTENRPLELWSIMDFLMPGYLGSSEFFRTHIERPILEDGPKVQITKFLNAKTRPFILRRTKAEVEKDLPPKIESDLHVEMAPTQAELYSQILDEVRPRVFDAVNKKGVRGASVSILAALLRLRQVCNHPNSIDSLKELEGFESGKFNLLKDLVTEALESGRKILLFSQFREMLAIIRRWLIETQINHLYLDGATKNRQDLIDKFNNDSEVKLFLISLKAGGTGLNLASADTVIIYDPWWNPAVEHQAVDRAHRIGQTKHVQVYRLITENSIEQKIMDLKSKKSKLVDALINENGLSTVSLSKMDLEHLFSPLPTT